MQTTSVKPLSGLRIVVTQTQVKGWNAFRKIALHGSGDY